MDFNVMATTDLNRWDGIAGFEAFMFSHGKRSYASTPLRMFKPFVSDAVRTLFASAAAVTWLHERNDFASHGLADMAARDAVAALHGREFADTFYRLADCSLPSVASAVSLRFNVVADCGAIVDAALCTDSTRWNLSGGDLARPGNIGYNVVHFWLRNGWSEPSSRFVLPVVNARELPTVGADCSDPLLAALRRVVLARAERASKMLHLLTAVLIVLNAVTTPKQAAKLIPVLFPNVSGDRARASRLLDGAVTKPGMVKLFDLVASVVASAGMLGNVKLPSLHGAPTALSIVILSDPTKLRVPALDVVSDMQIGFRKLRDWASSWIDSASSNSKLQAYL